MHQRSSYATGTSNYFYNFYDVYDYATEITGQTISLSCRNAYQSLMRYLCENDVIETFADTNVRTECVKIATKLISDYLPCVKVLTSGSFLLDVYLKGCDIDLLVLAPKHVNEMLFYDGLVNKLKERGINPKLTVSSSVCVLSFFIPSISYKIDVLLARCNSDINTLDLDTSVHSKLFSLSDKHSMRAINGYKMIMKLKEIIKNFDTFKPVLLAIKFWAKINNIYGNLGYFGGIVWSVMVAKVCIMFPSAPMFQTLYLFFHLYANWPWPKPVVLEPLNDGPNKVNTEQELIYFDNKNYFMPVISPVFPYENMTKLVSANTSEIIIKCLEKGCKTVEKMKNNDKVYWHEFFTL